MRGSIPCLSLLFACAALAGCASSHGAVTTPAAHVEEHAAAVGPDEALKILLDGNRRFVAGSQHARSGEVALRSKLATSQSPYAIIVSCSDSRVTPELVFDQTLGEIFVVRTAGQVLADPGLGSVEYAVEHLHSPLIVVLGHERCGAVSAAVAGGEAPGHIAALVQAIQPAVQASKGEPGDAVDNAVRAHVRDVVHQLENTAPILAEFVHAKHLKIVGAYYDLDTGEVQLLPTEKK